MDNVFATVEYSDLSPNQLSDYKNITNRFSKVMRSTISQLESEFKFDVMHVSINVEENIQNESLLAQICNQLEVLRRKILEVTTDVEAMRHANVSKPIDEIVYWKKKSDRLTKAFKLVNDERVKALGLTLDYAISHHRLDNGRAQEYME